MKKKNEENSEPKRQYEKSKYKKILNQKKRKLQQDAQKEQKNFK